MSKKVKGLFDKNKTLREKKHFKKGTKRYELHKKAKDTLGTGDVRQAVRLPEGEDLNEWLATNTVDFFNQINLLYGSITLFCTPTSCPIMCASPKYEYHWADEANPRPIKVSAPEYVEKLMDWIQSKLDNEELFPPTTDVPFPRHFQSEIKQIFKRLFRVYAHIYYSHFDKIVSLGEEAHLNTCFKHYYFFVTEFDLVPRREMAPLEDLIQNLTTKRD
jgi:MOB kinase activator 1